MRELKRAFKFLRVYLHWWLLYYYNVCVHQMCDCERLLLEVSFLSFFHFNHRNWGLKRVLGEKWTWKEGSSYDGACRTWEGVLKHWTFLICQLFPACKFCLSFSIISGVKSIVAFKLQKLLWLFGNNIQTHSCIFNQIRGHGTLLWWSCGLQNEWGERALILTRKQWFWAVKLITAVMLPGTK